MRTRQNSLRRLRGFTLVELIIAMAAGLVVATAALMLARNASRFFQHEARFSSAHLSAALGMSRLTADLQRAAFLSSPNVQKDPMICGSPATWPEGMKRLAGVTIRRNGSYAAHSGDLVQSDVNGLRPDSVIIGGAFGTNEQFDVRAMQFGAGAGWSIYLQWNSDARKRTQARASMGGLGFQGIFRAGRLLRISTDSNPPYVYGVISGVQEIGTDVVVQLEPAPSLPIKGPGLGSTCGLTEGASNENFIVNPVSRVLYDIRSLAGYPQYAALVAPISPAVTGDSGRTELVRVELDAQNNEMPDTLELVAEYAVDLKFGISTVTKLVNPGDQPVVDRYPITEPELAAIYNTAADIVDDGGTPERVRSVQVRLSTRTRAPDRNVELTYTAGAQMRRLRFLIPGIVPGVNALGDAIPAGAPPVFARMRTIHTEVALPNQERAQRW